MGIVFLLQFIISIAAFSTELILEQKLLVTVDMAQSLINIADNAWILKARQNRDIFCLPDICAMKKYSTLSDHEIFSAFIPLQTIRNALTLYYQFANWEKQKYFLKQENRQRIAEKNPSPIKFDIAPDMNSFISCLSCILSFYSEHVDTSYAAV